jgi:hypothetical protein
MSIVMTVPRPQFVGHRRARLVGKSRNQAIVRICPTTSFQSAPLYVEIDIQPGLIGYHGFPAMQFGGQGKAFQRTTSTGKLVSQRLTNLRKPVEGMSDLRSHACQTRATFYLTRASRPLSPVTVRPSHGNREPTE